MEAEELEQNLRRFAMRQASAASKEFSDLKSRVVVSVQSSPSRHCPMHGRHGNFQVSMTSPLEHSEKEIIMILLIFVLCLVHVIWTEH